jgi:hypothetical protein
MVIWYVLAGDALGSGPILVRPLAEGGVGVWTQPSPSTPPVWEPTAIIDQHGQLRTFRQEPTD